MICDSMVADLNEKSADVLSQLRTDRHNGELRIGCSKKELDIFKAAILDGYRRSYVPLFSGCKISINHKQLVTEGKVRVLEVCQNQD